MAALKGYVGAFYFANRWAVDFTGAGVKAVVSDSLTSGELDFADGGDFTLEAWVNVQGGAGDIIDKNGDLVGYQVDTSDGKFRFVLDDGTSDVSIVGTTAAGSTWHHVVCSRDAGTKAYLYVDGEFEGSDTDDTGDLSNASDLVFGNGTNTRWITLVRIYNTRVSAANVSDLYRGNFPGSLSSRVVGEWKFYDGAGSTLYDSSGNDNHATLVGNTSWITTTYDTVTNESDTGDGTTTSWTLDNTNVDTDSFTVDIDGTTQIYGRDYTITPAGTLTFTTAPASDAKIHTTYRYYPVTIEAGGFTNWTIDNVADTHDVTDFTSTGWREQIAGLKGWSGTAERHWINPLAVGGLSRKAILRFYLDEGNKVYYHGWGFVSGYHPSTAVDALVEETLDFQGTDRLVLQSDV